MKKLFLVIVMVVSTAWTDPILTSITPNEGDDLGGLLVTIVGSGFIEEGTTQVLFGSNSATNVVVGEGEGEGEVDITCITPAHGAGIVDLMVINPDSSSNIKEDAFTYVYTGQEVEYNWSSYIGGDNYELDMSIAIANTGVCIVGETASADWCSNGSYSGMKDGYLLECITTGQFLLSSYIGGIYDDKATSVAIDTDGDVYVGGWTQSTGWTSGGYDTHFDGNTDTLKDGFIVKYNTSGVAVWSSYIGGTGSDVVNGIVTEDNTAVYVVGSTTSGEGEGEWVSGGWDTTYNDGIHDGFLVKLTSLGAHVWSTFIGGSSDDVAFEVATGLEEAAEGEGEIGIIYVVGMTKSSGWISGGFDTTYGGVADGFVVKADVDGTELWSTYIGGADSDFVQSVAIDTNKNINVVGDTFTTSGPVYGWDTSYGGNGDGLIMQLSSDGNFVWASYIGGNGYDCCESVKTDANNNVYISGYTQSTDKWVSLGQQNILQGTTDGFIVKLDLSGQHIWSTLIGNLGSDLIHGIDLDDSNNFYVVGDTDLENWMSDGFDTIYGGVRDGFVLKGIEQNCCAIEIVEQPISNTIAIGDPYIFSMSTSAGCTPYVYTWIKNTTDNIIQIGTNSTYTLDNCSTLDTGDYSCAVVFWETYPTGEPNCPPVKSNTATLTVDPACCIVNIVTPPASDTTIVGAQFTFFIEAIGGCSSYIYRWMKDSTDNIIQSGTATTYTIEAIQTSDAGDYWVVLTYWPTYPEGDPECYSDLSTMATLIVNPDCPIYVMTHPDTNTVVVGEPFVFSTTVSSACSPIIYMWAKDSTDNIIAAGTDTKYTISTCVTEDAGEYWAEIVCWTTYPEGVSDCNAVISNTATLTVSGEGCDWYNSIDVPKSILDYTTSTSTLTITSDLYISDINAILNITHPYDADLSVHLISPDARRVKLFDFVGTNGDNFINTILDDSAEIAIAAGSAPFTNIYLPEESLSHFQGQNAKGIWILEIADIAGRDEGLLNSWGLQICGETDLVPMESSAMGMDLTPSIYLVEDFEYVIPNAIENIFLFVICIGDPIILEFVWTPNLTVKKKINFPMYQINIFAQSMFLGPFPKECINADNEIRFVKKSSGFDTTMIVPIIKK